MDAESTILVHKLHEFEAATFACCSTTVLASFIWNAFPARHMIATIVQFAPEVRPICVSNKPRWDMGIADGAHFYWNAFTKHRKCRLPFNRAPRACLSSNSSTTRRRSSSRSSRSSKVMVVVVAGRSK